MHSYKNKNYLLFLGFIFLFLLIYVYVISNTLATPSTPFSPDVVCCIVSPGQSLCYNTSVEYAPSCFGDLSEPSNYMKCNQKLFSNFYCLDLGECKKVLNYGTSRDPFLYRSCLSYYSSCNALFDKDVPVPDFSDKLDVSIFPGLGYYSSYFSDKVTVIQSRLDSVDVSSLKETIEKRISDCELKGYTEGLVDVETRDMCVPSCFSKEDCCNLELSNNKNITFCGTVDDGCGHKYECGDCPSNFHCEEDAYGPEGGICLPNDGSGFDYFRECKPRCNSTAECCAGLECGTIDDGCGNKYDCGSCSSGYNCESHICVPKCTPRCNSKDECCSKYPNQPVVDDGCGSSYACTTEKSEVVKPEYKLMIYVTKEKHDGNFKGDNSLIHVKNDCSSLSGDKKTRCMLDNFCWRNKPSDLICKDLHAFISVNSDDEIRDMPENYGYKNGDSIYWYNPNQKNFVRLAKNWNDMLDGSIEHKQCFNGAPSYYCTDESGWLSTYYKLWTGSNSNGASSWDCYSWSSSSWFFTMGRVGSSKSTSGNWLDVGEGSSLSCDTQSAIRCIGYCHVLKPNKKDIHFYNNNGVFVISSKDWKSILSLVPVAVWHESDQQILNKCKHPYDGFTGDLKDICAYPVLIYDEGLHGRNPYIISNELYHVLDYYPIINFIKDYDPNEVTFVNLSESVDSSYKEIYNSFLYKLARQTDAVLNPRARLNYISPEDYFKFWKSYNALIYSEDNFTTALQASLLASLWNIPLIIEDSSLDKDKYFSEKEVICVGNIKHRKSQCAYSFNVEDVKSLYASATQSNKLILINSYDRKFAKEVNASLQTFTQSADSEFYDLFPRFRFYSTRGSSIYYSRVFSNLSLASPFLAAAKKEMILDVHLLPQCKDVCKYVDNYFNFTGSGHPLNCNSICKEVNEHNSLEDFINNLNVGFSEKSFYEQILPAVIRHAGLYNGNVFSQKYPFMKREIFANKINSSLSRFAKKQSNSIDYLTIISAPFFIPFNLPAEGLASAISNLLDNFPFFYAFDTMVYAKAVNKDRAAVGRIMGYTVSDVSAYIARDLFYTSMRKPNKDRVLLGATAASQMMKRANKWTKSFKDSNFKAQCDSSDYDFSHTFSIDICKLKICCLSNGFDEFIRGLTRCSFTSVIWSYYDTLRSHLKDLQPILYFYQGHTGFVEIPIHTTWLVYRHLLHNGLLVIGGCINCFDVNDAKNSDFFNKRTGLFPRTACLDAIREGAIGYVGTAALTTYAPYTCDPVGIALKALGVSTDVFHNFINVVFAHKIPQYFFCIHTGDKTIASYDFGNALLASYTNSLFGEIEYMDVLIGDPTFILPLNNLLKDTLGRLNDFSYVKCSSD